MVTVTSQRLREEEARRQAALIRMHADERRARLERTAARISTEGAANSTDGSRKRSRICETQRADGDHSPGRREKSEHRHAGNTGGQSKVSRSRPGYAATVNHRYDESDSSSESSGEIVTAAAKARARKKASGGKRRARSAMFM